MGPLHGLPISLKDQICMKGLETTMGYVSWFGSYAERDAVLTTVLLEAGAVCCLASVQAFRYLIVFKVPFVRTNVPQTLMVGCCFLKNESIVICCFSGPKHSIMSSEGR